MTIRQAQPKDSFFVSKLILEPMKPLALLLAHTEDPEAARKLLEELFLRVDTQYSYMNTLVCEQDGTVAGSITAYDGGRLHELRKPVDDHIRNNKIEIVLTDETEAGEYYIDTLSVSPAFRGQGIAGRLLEAVCGKAFGDGHSQVGLIADPENTRALKLYEKTSFVHRGYRHFAGKQYMHLIRSLSV